MKLKIKQFFMMVSISCLGFILLACEKEQAAVTYVTPTEYVGVWYTSLGDNRGFIFHPDGKFEVYSVKPGEELKIIQTGMYGHDKEGGGRINLSESATGYDYFPISSQIWKMESNDELIYENTTLHRMNSTEDKDTFYSLAENEVPLEKFIGKWENDTIYEIELEIIDEKYTLKTGEFYTAGEYTKGYEYLLIQNNEVTVTENGNGTLTLTGYEGIFYPAGSGKRPPSPFLSVAGVWNNSITGEQITVNEDGGYLFSKITNTGGFSMATGLLTIAGEKLTMGDYIGSLLNNELVFQGIEGSFAKE